MALTFSKTLVAATLVIGGVASAQAEGLYVGGALGKSNYSSPINGITGSEGGASGKVFGGYQFTPNIAVEGGYFNLAHTRNDATGAEAKVEGAYVDAVGKYMFTPGWSVLGSAGLAAGRFKTSFGDDSSPALKAGVGVQYDITSQVAVTAQYDRFHFVNAFDAKPNIGLTTVGVKVGF